MTFLTDWRLMRAETIDMRRGLSLPGKIVHTGLMGGLRGSLVLCAALAFNGIAKHSPAYMPVTNVVKQAAGPGAVADAITWLQTRGDDERLIAAFGTVAEMPGQILAQMH